MALLARREHSRDELRAKLRRGCDDARLIEDVLDELAEAHLQSDQRHAFSYARQRAARGYGPLRIREELRGRGVSKELSSHAIEALEIDWLLAARAARVKRFGERPPADAAARGAQMRFLQYRGFPADIVRRCLTSQDDPAPDIFED